MITGLRKKRIKALLLLGGVLCVAAFGARIYFEPPRSVMLITIDTLRADHTGLVGPEGGKTPVMNELAAQGVSFTQAYSTSSLTAPSHASILTGQYPSWHSVGLYNGRYRLNRSSETLAERLKQNGCRTLAIVSNPVLWAPLGLDQGFDVYDDELEGHELNRKSIAERYAKRAVDLALAWLEAQNSAFFMWLHIQDPHGPYVPNGPVACSRPEKDRALLLPVGKDYSGYRSIPAYQVYGEERAVSDYVSRYNGEIANTDYHLGRLFAYLKKDRWFKNTLIILTADHGEALGEDDFYFAHGHSIGLDQVHVPLIISGAGISGNRRIDRTVSNLSIFKTVLDFMHIDIPPDRPGHSLLNADSSAAEIPVYVECLNQAGIFYKNVFLRRDRHAADETAFWAKGNPNSAGGIWRPLPDTEIRAIGAAGAEIGAVDVDVLKEKLAQFEAAAEQARAAAGKSGTKILLSPAQVRQLRSLGYVE